jgi:ribulose bisphosphate carboxylase small subunit
MTLCTWRLSNHITVCLCNINQCPHSPYQSKKLTVQTKEGDTRVQEQSRVLDQKCHHKTVEFVDENTGKISLRTIQVIEKTIEHEVHVLYGAQPVSPWF